MQKVNLADKFAQFTDLWSPKIAGELNGQYVKIVKVAGEFVWHYHENEDELFLVIRGVLHMDYRDQRREQRIDIAEGEFVVVPRGVEHRPSADGEAHVLLFEPAATLNTGNVHSERTVASPERM